MSANRNTWSSWITSQPREVSCVQKNEMRDDILSSRYHYARSADLPKHCFAHIRQSLAHTRQSLVHMRQSQPDWIRFSKRERTSGHLPALHCSTGPCNNAMCFTEVVSHNVLSNGFRKSTPPQNRVLIFLLSLIITITWPFCEGVDSLKPFNWYILWDKIYMAL